jgi:hypothetical protein
MFEKLKRFFQGEPPPVADKIVDPVLGPLSWSKDDEPWLSSPDHNAVGLVVHIAGTPQPDGALVRHAADITKNKEEFVRRVQRFLAEEASSVRHLSAFKEEVAGLKIESVCFFWPERPEDGMIFFAGGRDDRVWRCDYIGRKPKGLGFDS